MQWPGGRILQRHELDAFLAQAVSSQLYEPDQLQELKVRHHSLIVGSSSIRVFFHRILLHTIIILFLVFLFFVLLIKSLCAVELDCSEICQSDQTTGQRLPEKDGLCPVCGLKANGPTTGFDDSRCVILS